MKKEPRQPAEAHQKRIQRQDARMPAPIRDLLQHVSHYGPKSTQPTGGKRA